MMVGVGDEVPDGLGSGLAVAELLIDLLDRDRLDAQALPLPQIEQRLRGGKEGAGADEEIVGAVSRAAQGARQERPHLRVEHALRRDGEALPAGLGPEGDPARRRRRAEEPLGLRRRRDVEQQAVRSQA